MRCGAARPAGRDSRSRPWSRWRDIVPRRRDAPARRPRIGITGILACAVGADRDRRGASRSGRCRRARRRCRQVDRVARAVVDRERERGARGHRRRAGRLAAQRDRRGLAPGDAPLVLTAADRRDCPAAAVACVDLTSAHHLAAGRRQGQLRPGPDGAGQAGWRARDPARHLPRRLEGRRRRT